MTINDDQILEEPKSNINYHLSFLIHKVGEMKKIYRNGDLNFRQVEKMEGELVKHNGVFILARGEQTGHSHKITAERMEIRKTNDGRYYLSLPKGGTLTHEDHKTIVLDPGIYEQYREREKDWFSLSVRRVVD